MDYLKKLDGLGACPDAMEWLAESQFPTLQHAWDVCSRGDWMLRLWHKTIQREHKGEDELRRFVSAKALCAGLVVHLMDERSRRAVAVAERFGRSEATRQELDAAAADTVDAYTAYTTSASAVAAADAAAAYTAYTVVCANTSASAVAVVDAVYAFAAVAAAAADDDDAVAAAVAGGDWKNTLARCADFIRDVCPRVPQ